MHHLQDLALEGGDRVSEILKTEVLDSKGSGMRRCAFANVRLPLDAEALVAEARKTEEASDTEIKMQITAWMMKTLTTEKRTAIPVIFYRGCWWVRFSAQVYLELKDFEWGANVLSEVCERVGQGEWRT